MWIKLKQRRLLALTLCILAANFFIIVYSWLLRRQDISLDVNPNGLDVLNLQLSIQRVKGNIYKSKSTRSPHLSPWAFWLARVLDADLLCKFGPSRPCLIIHILTQNLLCTKVEFQGIPRMSR